DTHTFCDQLLFHALLHRTLSQGGKKCHLNPSFQCVLTQTHTHILVKAQLHIRLNTHTHSHRHTLTHTHTHTHTHSHTLTHTHTHTDLTPAQTVSCVNPTPHLNAYTHK